MFRALLCVFIFAFSLNSFASIAVNKSRIVFKEHSTTSNEITVANSGAEPVIIQSWIDDGEFSQIPVQVKSPFIVVPAVARINPGERRSFKVIRTTNVDDKGLEKLYWLNLYEVDLLKKTAESSLRVGVNTQMKVFYQPSALHGNKADAAKSLIIKKVKENGSLRLSFYNNSDYCVSLTAINLSSHGENFKIPDTMDMTLMPHSGKSFSFPTARGKEYSALSFSVINDDGTVSVFKRGL